MSPEEISGPSEKDLGITPQKPQEEEEKSEVEKRRLQAEKLLGGSYPFEHVAAYSLVVSNPDIKEKAAQLKELREAAVYAREHRDLDELDSEYQDEWHKIYERIFKQALKIKNEVIEEFSNGSLTSDGKLVVEEIKNHPDPEYASKYLLEGIAHERLAEVRLKEDASKLTGLDFNDIPKGTRDSLFLPNHVIIEKSGNISLVGIKDPEASELRGDLVFKEYMIVDESK